MFPVVTLKKSFIFSWGDEEIPVNSRDWSLDSGARLIMIWIYKDVIQPVWKWDKYQPHCDWVRIKFVSVGVFQIIYIFLFSKISVVRVTIDKSDFTCEISHFIDFSFWVVVVGVAKLCRICLRLSRNLEACQLSVPGISGKNTWVVSIWKLI